MNGNGLILDPRETALVRFLWEIDEHLTQMERAMGRLQSEANLELFEELYYLAYRIREGAISAGLNEVSRLAAVLENVFEHVRRGQVEMTSDLVALMMPSCEALRRLTEGVGAEESEDRKGVAPESNAIGDAVVSILC